MIDFPERSDKRLWRFGVTSPIGILRSEYSLCKQLFLRHINYLKATASGYYSGTAVFFCIALRNGWVKLKAPKPHFSRLPSVEATALYQELLTRSLGQYPPPVLGFCTIWRHVGLILQGSYPQNRLWVQSAVPISWTSSGDDIGLPSGWSGIVIQASASAQSGCALCI